MAGKMIMEIKKIVQDKASSYPEMADLVGAGDPWADMEVTVPETVPQLKDDYAEDELGVSAWSYRDPMAVGFKIAWGTVELMKMGRQLQKMDAKIYYQVATWVVAASLFAGVGGKFGDWTSFEAPFG